MLETLLELRERCLAKAASALRSAAALQILRASNNSQNRSLHEDALLRDNRGSISILFICRSVPNRDERPS
jgi:hypothetical protein